MALPSKSEKNIHNKSFLKRLSEYFPLFSKNNSIDNNFNISAEMKSYRKQTQQKLLDSHYVSSELFETVMDAFDDIEFENFEAESSTSLINTSLIDDESAPDVIKDGEFTIIFSKKKAAKTLKTKASKDPKSAKDNSQQPLPNIAG